jgi:DNA repair and recombination RAD54-like protein
MPLGKASGKGKGKCKGKGSDDDDDDVEYASSDDDDGGAAGGPDAFTSSDDDDDESTTPGADALSQSYRDNARALAAGGDALVVARAPLLASLTVKGCETPGAPSRKPFAPLVARGVAWDKTKAGATLGVNRYSLVYRTPGGSAPFVPLTPGMAPPPPVLPVGAAAAKPGPKPFEIPADFKPLVVWEPSAEDLAGNPELPLTRIEVPPRVAHWLRPHQREGVQFLCECVLQQRDFAGQGAILADDMGLGKTLQSVALIYTLLTQGFVSGEPVCRRCIVVCPVSLVANWGNEFVKWLGPGAVNVKALADANKDVIEAGIRDYCNDMRGVQVLVISYDAFRRHVRQLVKRDTDLLVCDEAHRLKNAETSTYKTLDQLKCRRRILLSGTPMQNALTEFFAMVNFTNPGVLGDAGRFSRHFQSPILLGREPFATDKERQKGDDRATELSNIVNQFILRRTNTLLSQHLPPKVIQVVCCALTPLQKAIYRHFQQQQAVLRMIDAADGGGGDDEPRSNSSGEKGGKGSGVQILPFIGLLKSLCNHPKLIYDVRKTSKLPGMNAELDKLFPSDFAAAAGHPKYSGKMDALDRLLCEVKAKTDDKFVLISNYTQTLDLFEALCKFRGWPFLRVDGSTTIKKRQERVDELGKAGNNYFCFLLSSKAGGCGLNLIGANRLVLFDPDWNPAVDKQAAARVWRDGQKKRCFVYRFLAAGSIEEKVYQRQLSKEGLADVMGGNNTEAQVSRDDLRDLFTYAEGTRSTTHDTLKCTCLTPLEAADAAAAGGKRVVYAQPNKCKAHAAPPRKRMSDDDNGGDGSDGDDDKDDPSSQSSIDSTDADAKAARALAGGVPDPGSDGSGSGTGAGGPPGLRLLWGQRGAPAEDDLANWAHHASVQTVPDPVMRLTHSSIYKPPASSASAAKNLSVAAMGASGGGGGGAGRALMLPARTSTRIAVAASAPKVNSFGSVAHRAGSGSGESDSDVDIIADRPAPDAVPASAPAVAVAGADASAKPATPGASGVRGKGMTPLTPITAPAGSGYEPVVFVFSCEVSGKAITGKVEELNRRATAMSSLPPVPKKDLAAADDDADAEDDADYVPPPEVAAAVEAAKANSDGTGHDDGDGGGFGGDNGGDDNTGNDGGDGGDGDGKAGKKKCGRSSRKKTEPPAPIVARPPPSMDGPKNRLPPHLVKSPPPGAVAEPEAPKLTKAEKAAAAKEAREAKKAAAVAAKAAKLAAKAADAGAGSGSDSGSDDDDANGDDNDDDNSNNNNQDGDGEQEVAEAVDEVKDVGADATTAAPAAAAPVAKRPRLSASPPPAAARKAPAAAATVIDNGGDDGDDDDDGVAAFADFASLPAPAPASRTALATDASGLSQSSTAVTVGLSSQSQSQRPALPLPRRIADSQEAMELSSSDSESEAEAGAGVKRGARGSAAAVVAAAATGARRGKRPAAGADEHKSPSPAPVSRSSSSGGDKTDKARVRRGGSALASLHKQLSDSASARSGLTRPPGVSASDWTAMMTAMAD